MTSKQHRHCCIGGPKAYFTRVNRPIDDDAAALLERLGLQRDPVGEAELASSRDERPDPELAGTPEDLAARFDIILPLTEASVRARIYRADLDAPRPILVWLHGGGFYGGSPDDIDTVLSAVARRGGVTVVALDYRLAPEHPFPAALTDSYDALRWLAEHGRALGGDGRLAVGGQSAGGNLAAASTLLAKERGEPEIAAQILCYPMLDFAFTGESHTLFDGVLFDRGSLEWCRDQYLAGHEPTQLAAPLLADSLAGLPPALVLTAGHDPLRDDGRRYAARLTSDGVSVRQIEYPGAIHAFLNFPGVLASAWRAVDDIASYLRAGLNRSAVALQHVTTLYDRARVAELREFYGALGLVEKSVPEMFAGSGIVWFDAGDHERELHFVPHDHPEAAPHLCLNVDDLTAAAAKLGRLDVELTPDDGLKDRPRFSCADPFGNSVEIVSMSSV